MAKQQAGWSRLGYAFREIIWPRRRILLVGLALLVVNRLAGLVLPGASKYLVDRVIGQGDLDLLRWLLAGVAVAVVAQAVTSFSLTRLLSVEAQYLISQLRVRVQQQVIRLPLRFFDDHPSGSVVSRIMNDVEGVRNLVGTGFVYMVGGLITSAGALALILRISPLLTGLSLIPLALFGLISLKAFAHIRPLFRRRWAINADVTGRLTESIGGIRVIRGFHAEGREEQVFAKGVDRLFQNVKRSLTATALVRSVATGLMGLASVAIMGVGGTMIVRGELTIGDFVAFTLYLGFLVAPIVQMSNIGTQFTEAFAGLDRMEEILRLPREGEEPERDLTIGPVNGEIRFEEVSFAYEEDQPVLQEISFQAPPGSVTALVGSSGSGKSTLAGLAASFLAPTSGRVLVDGIDLARVRLPGYRSQLGVVLQEEFLFDGTIRENILFARPDASEADLMAAVGAAYVDEFTDRFESGLNQVIGERGVKLSGGQRQRVAIARALLADPRILILDEATSSLDTESEGAIQRSLDRLLEGRTTLVIAHRLSTIRRADQILVIEAGRIVEQGNHDDLIARQGRYFELYTYQARI